MKNQQSAPREGLTALQDIVESLPHHSVMVVGDIMLDRFVYGDVHRISPESPVPVLSIQTENRMLGGAGNVLSNLAGLGVQAHILAVVGQDSDADAVRALLVEKNVDPAGLIIAPDRPTIVKTRFLASHQQLLRTDYERNGKLPEATEEALIKKAIEGLPQMGALILSDYGKGVLSEHVISTLIKKARKLGVPVLVDPKKADYSIYKGASIITPNRNELAEATNNMPTKTDDDIVAATTYLMKQAGVDAILATRSQDGMTLMRANKKLAPVHLRTEALEVFDVSGAGDTVIATVAAALAAGADLVAAAALSNIAGGIVVAKVGTAPIRRKELIAAIARKELDISDEAPEGRILDTAREAKVCDAEEAAEIVQRWKARGMKVGFTNGCFDILHPGHVSYLNQARARCDRLVIGLNSDASVKRLKGAERPVNEEQARAIVLGALGAVDMVVIFGDDRAEDDKPVRLIGRMKPDIFFKGGDYRESDLPEAPVVRAYGGQVELMSHFDGHSTTATIKKLKSR